MRLVAREDCLMRTCDFRRLVWRAVLVMAGLGAVAWTPSAQADSLPAFTGFTRPGAPNDSRGPEGQVVLVSTDAEVRKRAVGGTVYLSPAPAVPATRPYQLRVLPTRRGPFSEQPGGGVARVVQEVLDPVQEPDYVMLLAGAGEGTAARTSPPSLRSIWNSYLLKG